MENYDYLVMSGGGSKGFLQMGALVFIERWLYSEYKKSIKTHFKGFAGTSVGALLIFCVVCGLSTTEMIQISARHLPLILTLDFSLVLLQETHGLRDNESIRNCIQEIFYQSTGRRDMSFLEFYQVTQKEFTVCACNVCISDIAFFNRFTTPTVSITDALLASMAVPFVFAPVTIGDQLFIDGGCQLNVPLSIFPVDRTLALWIRDNLQPIKPTNLVELSKLIFRSFYYSQDTVIKECYREQRRNIIQLFAPESTFLLAPVTTNALPIRRGYLTAGLHLLTFTKSKLVCLFWLITDQLYQYIVYLFV